MSKNGNGQLTAMELRELLKALAGPGREEIARLGRVEVKLTLRKYDGDYDPDKEPVEVIERTYRR